MRLTAASAARVRVVFAASTVAAEGVVESAFESRGPRLGAAYRKPSPDPPDARFDRSIKVYMPPAGFDLATRPE